MYHGKKHVFCLQAYVEITVEDQQEEGIALSFEMFV